MDSLNPPRIAFCLSTASVGSRVCSALMLLDTSLTPVLQRVLRVFRGRGILLVLKRTDFEKRSRVC